MRSFISYGILLSVAAIVTVLFKIVLGQSGGSLYALIVANIFFIIFICCSFLYELSNHKKIKTILNMETAHEKYLATKDKKKGFDKLV